MDNSKLLLSEFPLSSKYNPEWILAGASGGANPLWLTEWLSSSLELRPGMRVLDLGCGKAMSSIFLHREFGLEVWATDLWFSATENLQRIRDAGVEKGVFPVHADARFLPFAHEFFDAIISIDSFIYYGTDDLYLSNLARFLKPDGQLAIAGSGLIQEFDGEIPAHLQDWWTPEHWCLHAADWWKRHWDRTGIIQTETADSLPYGWRLWRDWLSIIAPDNHVEIDALEKDEGRYLGYVRVAGRREPSIQLEAPIVSIPSEYIQKPLLNA